MVSVGTSFYTFLLRTASQSRAIQGGLIDLRNYIIPKYSCILDISQNPFDKPKLDLSCKPQHMQGLFANSSSCSLPYVIFKCDSLQKIFTRPVIEVVSVHGRINKEGMVEGGG